MKQLRRWLMGGLAIILLDSPMVLGAPGTLSQVPLFLAPYPPPNIFFALDDSGSMKWSMPADGAESGALIKRYAYDTVPDDRKEWRAWCRGANLLAYNPNVTYKPWNGVDPLNGQPFPDMTDITRVWVNPAVAAGIDGDTSNDSIEDNGNGNYVVKGDHYAIIDLSKAPVIKEWKDKDKDGVFDPEECPVPDGDYKNGRASKKGPAYGFYSKSPYVTMAKDLPPAERTNFANWFAYYRTRMHATKAAVTRVVATSNARMGMSTLHRNNGEGVPIKDMSDPVRKDELLEHLVAMKPSGGTPLRRFLNDVGKYFSQKEATPSTLFGNTGNTLQKCKNACDDTYDDAVKECKKERKQCRSKCNDDQKQCRDECKIIRNDCRTACGRDKNCRNQCDADYDSCKAGCDDARRTCRQQCDTERNECKAQARDARTACYKDCEKVESANKPILPAEQGGECQQNFVLLMTDGTWNGKSNPGVGNQDGIVDNKYVYPAHKDTYGETLADVAMKWYKTDLAPSLAGKVPTQKGDPKQNLDENKEQHLVTFTVAFGPTGTLKVDPSDRTKPFTWPRPSRNAKETVDDLRHAAYNGRGRFLSASNPQELIDALEDTIDDIQSRQGSAAAVALNSTSLSAGSRVFSAVFNSEDWSGDLLAREINVNYGSGVSFTDVWSAAEKLDAHTDSNITSQRVIYTVGNTASGVDGVLFTPGSGTAPLSGIVDDLRVNPDGTQDTSPYTQALRRGRFLQGDRSREGVDLRRRGSRLGDILNSAPEYVGAPASGWPDTDPFGVGGSRYSAYQAAQEASPREAVIYVGANDGMLHGFRVSDGEEVLAYLPSAVASSQTRAGLHFLSDKGYSHRYYVDGGLASADVYIRTRTGESRAWRTVLVGALGAGGRGIFALDVTDPEGFERSDAAAQRVVLWEFTDRDDPDLGYTVGTPQIAMMNNGKWAVIFGNGYNAPGSPTAQLFIVYLERLADGHWSPGDVVKIDTGVGSGTDANGLATPALIDLDDDGTVDRIYAGDLYGNLWAFDVSQSSDSDWHVAYWDPASLEKYPLFAGVATMPITVKPLVLKPSWIEDTSNNAPNVMVFFGTGQYLAEADAMNTHAQRFYGIWDAGVRVTTTSQLVAQGASDHSTNANYRFVDSNPVNYADPPLEGKLGWYIALPESGERVVTEAALWEEGELLLFNTAIPSYQPCSAGGSHVSMRVSLRTGGSTAESVFDTNNDWIFDGKDLVGGKVVSGIYGEGIVSAPKILEINPPDEAADSGNKVVVALGCASNTNSNKPECGGLGGRPKGGAASGRRVSWEEVVP